MYRRRVTVDRGASPAAETGAVEPEADLILEALAAIPRLHHAPSDCDGESAADAAGGRAPRQRLLPRLNRLLRRRR